MEIEKAKQLKKLLKTEQQLRNKFTQVRDTVVSFIDEINKHDNEWQEFWKQEIGFQSPGRFIHNQKTVIIQKPKNLYQNEIYVEGIFYKENFSIIDYVEEESPIILDSLGEEGNLKQGDK
jgi:type IV secretory pathway VirB9-like protein